MKSTRDYVGIMKRLSVLEDLIAVSVRLEDKFHCMPAPHAAQRSVQRHKTEHCITITCIACPRSDFGAVELHFCVSKS